MPALMPSSAAFLHFMAEGGPQLQVGPQLQRRAARTTAVVTTEGREVASSRLPLAEPQKLRRNQPQPQHPATALLRARPQLKVCSWRHS